MKRADLWSLGMLPLCIVNPATKVPYFEEAKVSRIKQGQREHYVKTKILLGLQPKQDRSHQALCASAWYAVEQAFKGLVVKEPSNRMSLQRLSDLLNQDIESQSFPLRIHHGSAMEKAQEKHPRLSQPVNQSEPALKVPENNGTNACAFLCLKLFEEITNDRKNIEGWVDLREREQKNY
eukprot:Seg6526.1 transcript_id=Seg6526.1/GoldUCD/mRNA.D3Y31 product="hypothetical protein" protein_id=Seg6526.1/GoldUCD/D3Y31